MTTEKRIQALIDEAFDLAVAEVERRARAIMKAHPRCASFCMGMGTATFYDKAGEPINVAWGPLPYPKYLKDFDAFVNDMDRCLHMTGQPMKINGADAPKITDW